MNRRLVALMVVSSLSPCGAQGAEPPSVGPGSHVRVSTIAGGKRLDGHVTSIDDATLTVLARDRSVTIPVKEITSLHVVTGRRGHALWGAPIGAVGGFILGGAGCDEECDGQYVGAGVFGALGALAGALIRSDRWAVVPTKPAGAGLMMVPGRERRAGAGLAIAFSF